MFLSVNPSRVTDSTPLVFNNEISLTIRRLDLIDTITGGNKWYKLRYNLERFRSGNYSELVTFGGAYSNHIAAVARACKLAKIPCTGIIRSERAYAENTTLSRAQQDGMQLKFVSRTDYGHKNNLEYIMALFPGLRSGYFVPEGGRCRSAGGRAVGRGCFRGSSQRVVGL